MQSPATRPTSRCLTVSQRDMENRLLHRDNRQLLQAIFLDRDGTVNAERGYILDPNDVELCPTAGEAINAINRMGILTIVITNQASIDKKLLSQEQFEKINRRLWNELLKADAHYDALYFCPHSPEITPNCICRKPQPGLILQAAQDFKINLSSSFMIGDKLSDIEAGQKAGCKTILVLTGRGEKSRAELKDYLGQPPDFICQNLKDAITWLLPKICER